MDVAAAQAEDRKAPNEEVATIHEEAEQAAEEVIVAIRAKAGKSVDDEFGADFFQGYSDLEKGGGLGSFGVGSDRLLRSRLGLLRYGGLG